MRCGLYEKLLKDNTLLQPDEYIFLCTGSNSTFERNKTRKKKLPGPWIDASFTDHQNEFYEMLARKIPNSRSISTNGKNKTYVSEIIAEILNVQELEDKDL